ncbi:MAG: carbohydrate-binding family 9-like protein [Myxococcales bacterium]|nr:carbohydrate-binding family 9-like protein [Myxococcales bacterium]
MLRKPLILLAIGAVGFGACVEQEADRPSAADRKAVAKHILKAPPAKLKFKVDADLEGKVVYLGVDVDRDKVKPGVRFTLTHYWKVKKAVPGWRVFTHLADPARKLFVNADHKPINGRYPARFWKPGEIIQDVHPVTLPRRWSSPKVQVFTGLWKGKLRMKPSGPKDKENRVIAATIDVDLSGRRVVRKKAEPLKQLLAVQAKKAPKIDGKLDDEVWKTAPSTGPFVNTISGQRAAIATEAKVAWDKKYLYVAFDNKDTDIWSDFKKRDDKLWTQEAVEIFIDANGDGKEYIELQVSPAGVIFDSYLASYRKNDNAWNSKVIAKVKIDGTLNKRKDTDKGWTVEVAIPWADVQGKATAKISLPPKVGDKMRINLFRMDKPAKGPQQAACWSPPKVGDFHKLDRFGWLVFADAEGKAPAPTPKKAAAVQPKVMPPGAARGRVVKMAMPAKRTVHSLQPKSIIPMLRKQKAAQAAAKKKAAAKAEK